MSARIHKFDKKTPTELELQVATFLNELESTSDMREVLSELMIAGVKEFTTNGKKSIVVSVPIKQQKVYQKIHSRLIREFEKKFNGMYVFIQVFRTILPKQKRNCSTNQKQKRPVSRTLTHVHEQILSDLVYPAEIVGKRVRVNTDGSRLIKCHLDKHQQLAIEHKVDHIGNLYKQMTGKDVQFEFPDWVL